VIIFYFLILLLPLANHPLWTMSIAGVTPIKILGLLNVLYALGYLLLYHPRPHFFRTRQARWFVAFIVLAGVSFVAKDHGFYMSAQFGLIYASVLLLFFVTVIVVDSLRHLRLVLISVVASMAVASAYVLREWYKYHNLYPGFRAGWIAGDSNYFAASALIALPIAYYFFRMAPRRWEGRFCLAAFALTLFAVMLTASRGGFLGLLVGLLLIVWRSKARIRNFAVMTLLVVPIVLLAPSSPLQRLLDPGYSERIGSEVRLVLWKAGMHMIADHPVFGVGLGNFAVASTTYMDNKTLSQYKELAAYTPQQIAGMACNAYVQTAAELGITGFVVFVGLLVSAFWSLETTRRRARKAGPKLLFLAAQSMQVSLVSFAVALVFLDGEYLKLFWLLLFVSMTLPGLLSGKAAVSREASPAQQLESELVGEILPTAV